MKARIKFQKYGAMKFIGHLDVMRYFQKAFRRAEFDNEYTKGFSPHQIMSFAAPLGVGLTSDSEYLDISLLSSEEPKVMIDRLNSVITEGFKITSFHPLQDPIPNQRVITAMSLVASADYLVSLKDGYSIGNIRTQEDFTQRFGEFMAQKEIVIDKKTKNSEKAVDIKPMITLAAFDEQDYAKALKEHNCLESEEEVKSSPEEPCLTDKPESMADRYDNGIKVYLQVDTGSQSNLKPELVLEAFYGYMGLEYEKFAWQVHRLEVYTKDEESGRLISLDQLER